MTDMERPDQRTNASRARVEVTTTDTSTVTDVAALRRRRLAAWRCAPIDDRGLRDPWADRLEISMTPGKWERAA